MNLQEWEMNLPPFALVTNTGVVSAASVATMSDKASSGEIINFADITDVKSQVRSMIKQYSNKEYLPIGHDGDVVNLKYKHGNKTSKITRVKRNKKVGKISKLSKRKNRNG